MENIAYRRCGNSGILLPEISLGFWHNFGASDNYADGLDMVKYAFDHGICHFDLANNYGPPAGSAEENFGKMLREQFQTHRDEMFISSKAGHEMWEGPYGGNSSRKNLMASIDQSLKRMGVDYVDLFYSHRYDGVTPIDETMQALVDIVHQGKALYIGLSKYPIDKLIYALNYLHEAHVPCLAYQARYNLLDRAVEEHHLSLCQKNGIGFVAFSPLAQGLLTGKYQQGIPSGSRIDRPEGHLQAESLRPDLLQKIARLQEIARRRNQPLAQMALAWLLHTDRVTSVIIGARNLAQLKDNLAATGNTRFSDEEINDIQQALQ